MRRFPRQKRSHPLAQERQKEAELVEQLTPSELLAIVISKDRDSWLDRENLHLDSLLEKEKNVQ